MKTKIIAVLGVLVIVSALLVGFLVLQPSPDELLTQSIDVMKEVTSLHAVIEINAATHERDIFASLEVWAEREQDHSGRFRAEVLEANEADVVGAVILSDGENLWAYSESKNTVYVGTREELLALMAEQEFEHEYDGRLEDYQHPEQ